MKHTGPRRQNPAQVRACFRGCLACRTAKGSGEEDPVAGFPEIFDNSGIAVLAWSFWLKVKRGDEFPDPED